MRQLKAAGSGSSSSTSVTAGVLGLASLMIGASSVSSSSTDAHSPVSAPHREASGIADMAATDRYFRLDRPLSPPQLQTSSRAECHGVHVRTHCLCSTSAYRVARRASLELPPPPLLRDPALPPMHPPPCACPVTRCAVSGATPGRRRRTTWLQEAPPCRGRRPASPTPRATAAAPNLRGCWRRTRSTSPSCRCSPEGSSSGSDGAGA